MDVPVTNVLLASEAPQASRRWPFLIDVLVRLVKTKPLGTAGLIIVLVLFAVGILADVLAPYGYNNVNLAIRLMPPSSGHLLGTDQLGRDILSRIIYGARISMIVGLSVAAISTFLATLIGGLSGFFGGKVDFVIQRFVDTVMCIPPLIITLTVVSVVGPGILTVILILGVVGGIGGTTRVVRSAVLGIKSNTYFEAARAIGVRRHRIFLRHVMPNIFAPIVILFSVSVGGAILAEASLSFLGFGIPPPYPDWGRMLSGSGIDYMRMAPWMALWPGLALAIVVFGVNMLGDALRDLFDPRLRGGLGRYGRAKPKSAPKTEVQGATEVYSKRSPSS